MRDISLKINWANKRIDEFGEAIKRFSATNPYSIRVETNFDISEVTVRVLKADSPPAELSLLAGDAFQNLRTALDYLVCQLVTANGGKVKSKTNFPIFERPIVAAHDISSFEEKVEGMRNEAKQVILGIKPYKGGDDTLWRLGKLNNLDKHHLLVTCWGSLTAVNGFPPPHDQWVKERYVSLPGAPFPLKNGDEFTIKVPNLKLNENPQFFLEICLNQPQVAENFPMILALRQSWRRVFEIAGKLSIYLK